MYEFLRSNHPRMDDADEGRFGAFIYAGGRPYKRYKPIAITVGAVDALARAWKKDGGVTTIKLSTISLFERFASSGKVQIDRERFSYTGKNAGTLELIGVLAGVDQTEKTDHAEGAGVYEVLPSFKYVVCENPRYVHFTKAIPAVYVNGRLKTADENPKHTINLDDRNIVGGRSFVTISFDLTTIKADEIQEPIPLPPPRHVTITMTPPTTGIIGYASSGGGGGGVAGVYRVPPRPPQPIGPKIEGNAIGSRTRVVKEWPVPVIGAVECDVIGLQDDSIGTITGTPFALIERPAHVVRTQLREAWGRRDDAEYNLTSFSNTHVLQLQDGIRWCLAYEGEDFEAWKFSALLAGKAHIYHFAGKWYYTYRKKSASTSFTFDPDNDAWPNKDTLGPTFSMTPRTELVTELPVAFDRGVDRREFLLRSLTGVAKYGIQRNRLLDLEWIYDLPVARLLGLYWLGQWDRQRVSVVVSIPWRHIAVEPWDVFAVKVPIMITWGTAQVQFHVLDVGANPDDTIFLIAGEEADPPGIALSGLVRVKRTIPLTLSGKVVVGVPPVIDTGVFRLFWPGLFPVAWDGPWVVIGSTTPPGMFQPGMAQPGMGQEGAM